jgi:hypothetical protein
MGPLKVLVAVSAGLLLAPGATLAADSGPAIVVPGRLGVPVILNGVEASGTVVEGDWGLYKPVINQPRIIRGPGASPVPENYVGYFPTFGQTPGYGRYEIEPPANRVLPPPAPSFQKSWSSQSDPVPASIDPPMAPPTVIVTPEARRVRPAEVRRPQAGETRLPQAPQARPQEPMSAPQDSGPE